MNSIDRKVIALIALATLVMLGSGLGSFRYSAELKTLLTRQLRMSQVQNHLEDILIQAAEAQRGSRDFLRAGDEASLERCHAALQDINSALREIHQLAQSGDTPSELESLDGLLAEEIRGIQQTFELRQKRGPGQAQERYRRLSAVGRLARAENLVRRIRDKENDMIKENSASLTATAGALPRMMTLGILLTLGFGLMVGWLIHREGLRRGGVEKALREKSEILASVLHNMGEGVMVTDLQGRFLVTNPTVRRFFGKGTPKLDGDSDLRRLGIYRPDGKLCPYDELPLVQALQGHKVDDQELLVRNEQVPEGCTVSASGRPLMDAHDRLSGGIVVFKDITRQKEIAEELRVANQVMQETVSELKDRNLEVGQLARLVEAMQACQDEGEIARAALPILRALFGCEGGGIYALSPAKDLLTPLAGWGSAWKGCAGFEPGACWALRRGRFHFSEAGEHNLACAHLGDSLTPESLCVPLMAQGEFVGLVHLVSDKAWVLDERALSLAAVISEQMSLALGNMRLREFLKRQSVKDPLTGLHNRRFFNEALDREYAKAVREGKSLAMIMIDLDHFKRFNDEYGHEAGDEVLRAMSRVLQTGVPNSDFACRLGGEELAGILPGLDTAGAQIIAEKIRGEVAELALVSANRSLPKVTISIGVADVPGDAHSTQELLRHSDEALYAAKNAGRNRVVCWSGSKPEQRVDWKVA